MADNTRIEELRRRVQSDPASIAFAALAEEYRRAGQHEEAIATCRAGLRRHPAYLSAHVTLGRALIEVGQYDEAREQLEQVLKLAPENLAAIRGLAEIHHRLGKSEPADLPPDRLRQGYGESAQALRAKAEGGRHASATPAAPRAATLEPAAAIPLTRAEPVAVSEPAPWEMPLAAPEQATSVAIDRQTTASASIAERQPVLDPALPRLEEFLAAILRARTELEGTGFSSRP